MNLIATGTYVFPSFMERGNAYVGILGVFYLCADDLEAFSDGMKNFLANMPCDLSSYALEQTCSGARVRIRDKRYEVVHCPKQSFAPPPGKYYWSWHTAPLRHAK